MKTIQLVSAGGVTKNVGLRGDSLIIDGVRYCIPSMIDKTRLVLFVEDLLRREHVKSRFGVYSTPTEADHV